MITALIPLLDRLDLANTVAPHALHGPRRAPLKRRLLARQWAARGADTAWSSNFKAGGWSSSAARKACC